MSRFVLLMILILGSVGVWDSLALAAAPGSANELWEKGKEHFQQALDHDDEADYRKAESYLAKALVQMPDNVNLQVDYYRLLFAMVREELLHIDRLREQFALLHPNVKEMVEAPSMVSVLKSFERRSIFSSESEVPDAEKIKRVQIAIAEQPKSGLGWYILSVLYKEQKQYNLALNAAKTGVELDKADADFNYLIGDIYYLMAASGDCIYEESELLKKSTQHLAKAIGANARHGSTLYAMNVAAFSYNRLGLFPLALDLSRKAYGRMVFRDIGRLYPESLPNALIYMGKPDDAFELMNNDMREVDLAFFNAGIVRGKQYFNGSAGYRVRFAIASLSKGDWKRAYTEYIKAIKRSDKPQLRWTGQWIHELYAQKSPRFVKMLREEKSFRLEDEGALNAWAENIQQFLSADGVDESQLIDSASNSCQKVEAHFYTAMRHWRQGELAKSQYQLRETVKVRAYCAPEHMWATALLKSDIFDALTPQQVRSDL